MYLYNVDVDIDEDDVLESLSDKELISELKCRGYSIINDESSNLKTPKDIIIKIREILQLREISNIDDIIKEINDLKNYI